MASRPDRRNPRTGCCVQMTRKLQNPQRKTPMNNKHLAGASTQTRCPSCEHHPILLDGRCLDCDYSQMIAAPTALATLQPTAEMAGCEIVTAARLPQNSGFRLQEVVTPTSPPPAAAGSPDTSSSSAQEQLPQATESSTSAKRSAARAAAAPKTKKRKTEAPESEAVEANKGCRQVAVERVHGYLARVPLLFPAMRDGAIRGRLGDDSCSLARI